MTFENANVAKIVKGVFFQIEICYIILLSSNCKQ